MGRVGNRKKELVKTAMVPQTCLAFSLKKEGGSGCLMMGGYVLLVLYSLVFDMMGFVPYWWHQEFSGWDTTNHRKHMGFVMDFNQKP